jgi:hypothetical protein
VAADLADMSRIIPSANQSALEGSFADDRGRTIRFSRSVLA